MKFNITPSHSPSPSLSFTSPSKEKYSVFSEWKNPVTRAKKREEKILSFLDCQNVCVIPKAYRRWKKEEIYWGLREVHEKISLFGISNSFLWITMIASERASQCEWERKNIGKKKNLIYWLCATLECVSKKERRKRKFTIFFILFCGFRFMCAYLVG